MPEEDCSKVADLEQKDESSDGAKSDGVCGTDITMELLETTLQGVFGVEAKFGPAAKTEDIGFMNGFLSFILRLHPDWQAPAKDEKGRPLPATLVVKIPSSLPMEVLGKKFKTEEQLKTVDATIDFKKQMEMFVTTIRMAHASEASFYELAMRDKLEEQLTIPHCYFQRQFGANGESGLLIMEDLSEKGGTKRIYEGIPVESIKALFHNLATVHAYSLKNEEWRDHPDLQLTFGKFQKFNGGTFGQMLGAMLSLFKSTYAETFDPLIDRLVDIFHDGFDAEKMDGFYKEMGLPPVMTHGDLWINNIMFEKKKEGEDGTSGTTDKLAAIVDWQLVHPGCIGEDFVRMMVSSVDPDVRRQHLEELVEYYHGVLREKLGREPPFTVAQILHAYKRMFLYGVMMILPMYGGYLAKESGMLGTEDVDARQATMLRRARCMIEDVYKYEDELKAMEKQE